MERLDDLLKAFRSLETETQIISTDFTAGTHRLSSLTVPVLANRWNISYPKSVKKHCTGTFNVGGVVVMVVIVLMKY